MKGQLILENGKRFNGKMFGAIADVVADVVFTTGMTGYQEVLTDPALAGQIVTMTFPLIGNYGINFEDMESEKVNLKALVVREKCDFPSNFRMEMNLEDFLKQQGVVGIEGIDTRALTRILRTSGSMKGVIVKGEPTQAEVDKLFGQFDDSSVVSKTTVKEKYVVNKDGNINVSYIDLGGKNSQLEAFKKKDCKVTVYPAYTKAEEILEGNPDLVFISSGPGDPAKETKIVDEVKKLIGKVSLSGIGLGHLIIGLALGAKTEKMSFGHHGANQPVRDTQTKKIYITSQNHDYVLTNLPEDVLKTFENVNDGTCEGIEDKKNKIKSIQFHAENSKSLDFIFDGFLGEVR